MSCSCCTVCALPHEAAAYRVRIQTEEQEAAEAFAGTFADPSGAFADLMHAPDAQPALNHDAPPANGMAEAPKGDQQGGATLRAQLLSTQQQRRLAAAHACMVHAALLKLLGRSSLSADSALLATPGGDAHSFASEHDSGRFALGMAVLEATDCNVPPHIDCAASSSLLRSLLSAHQAAAPRVHSKRGATHTAGGNSIISAQRKHSTAHSEGVDVEGACHDEAALAVKPVAAVQERAQALLARFEEQPLLLQLDAICGRILGAYCTSDCRLCVTVALCSGSAPSVSLSLHDMAGMSSFVFQ